MATTQPQRPTSSSDGIPPAAPRQRQRSAPPAFVIRCYLVSDPGLREQAQLVELGEEELLKDPRLGRIVAYEDGASGVEDAPRVHEPFLDAVLARTRRPRLAMLLYDAGS